MPVALALIAASVRLNAPLARLKLPSPDDSPNEEEPPDSAEYDGGPPLPSALIARAPRG